MDPKNTNEIKIMTIKEVSDYLKLPLSTVYDLAAKGKIRGVRFGRHWRFIEQDILNYLQYGERNLPPMTETRTTEKRRFLRANTEISGTATVPLAAKKDLNVSGTIHNLCEGGLFLVYDEKSPQGAGKLEAGDPVKIYFSIPEVNGSGIEAEGRVMHERAPARSGTSQKGAGIKFKNLPESIREMIRNYVA